MTPHFIYIGFGNSKNNLTIWPFAMTSSIFRRIFLKWRHIFSYDVITSDFDQIFRNVFLHQYEVPVKFWWCYDVLNRNYGHFSYSRITIETYRNLSPDRLWNSITFDLCLKFSQNVANMFLGKVTKSGSLNSSRFS